jgi:hypothetical protein
METAALALYYHAAQLIKAGKSHKDIIEELVSKGVNRDTAENMLTKLNQSRSNVARKQGYRNVLIGVVISIVTIPPVFGLFVPQFYGIAFGTAVFVWIFGLFLLIRGILQISGI